MKTKVSITELEEIGNRLRTIAWACDDPKDMSAFLGAYWMVELVAERRTGMPEDKLGRIARYIHSHLRFSL